MGKDICGPFFRVESAFGVTLPRIALLVGSVGKRDEIGTTAEAIR